MAKVGAACDAVLLTEYDRVMPVFGDESLYTSRFVLGTPCQTALDLGTGSGILAIAAAQGAERVVGVDINPKAVRYARQAALMNAVKGKCDFAEGDLYEPVRGKRFDLIVVNPPFVPLPFGYEMYLSADGGPDGLSIVRRVLKGVDDHLTGDGRFLMLTLCLGDERDPLVYRYLRKAFRLRRVRVTTTHIYETERLAAEPFFELFSSVPTYSQWRRFLDERGLTHLYYMLHEVEPHDRFEHVERRNRIPLEQSEFSGSWAARLNRFRTWLQRKSSAEPKPQDEAKPLTSVAYH